jgi:hypothetical protein
VDEFWNSVSVDLLLSARFNSSMRVLESNTLAPFMGSLSRRSAGWVECEACVD